MKEKGIEIKNIQRVICGDNLRILKTLEDESVDLIYIDPPFFTQKNYEIIWNDGAEIRQFGDRWITEKSNGTGRASKDINVYLEWMQPRIKEMHRVLKVNGTYFLHCDWHADSYLRVLCDQIFDNDPFSIITWKRREHSLARGFDMITDTILMYVKGKEDECTFNNIYQEISQQQLKTKFPLIEKETGRKYNTQPLEKSSNKAGVRIIQGREIKSEVGWVWSQKTIDERLAKNPYLIYWTENGKPRYKDYADEHEGMRITNLWTDIPPISSKAKERLGYPTQKPEALLERIIKISSNKNDLVLDAFAGCGTTLAVAKKLGRQFIGIDISSTACRLVVKRLGMSIKTVEGLPITREEIATLDGFEFQNWIIREFAGFSGTRGADGGIDGYLGECLIQVKKYKAGRNDLDAFVGTLLREKKEEGIFIAINFSVDFRKEVARLKRENEIIIHAFTVEDVVNEEHHEIVKRFMPKKGLELYL